MIYPDTINGKNLFTEFGLIIQTGTADLLGFPDRKEPNQNDWAESNGVEYDLGSPKFKDKSATLKCAIIANNDSEFWNFYKNLFTELSKPGLQNLFINDHSATYKVFYTKLGSIQKSTKRLKNIEKVLVKFELVLQVDNFIQELQMWGRNLFKNSKTIASVGTGFASDGSSSQIVTADDITITTSLGGGYIYFFTYATYTILPIVGDVYTFSIDVFIPNTSSTTGISISENQLPSTYHNNLPKDTWNRIHVSGVLIHISLCTIRIDGVSGSVAKLRNFKIEKGNKPTDWTPAPEDNL